MCKQDTGLEQITGVVCPYCRDCRYFGVADYMITDLTAYLVTLFSSLQIRYSTFVPNVGRIGPKGKLFWTFMIIL